MILWRLSLEKYASTAFSGQGSYLYGGRWSPPGCTVVYLSDSVSLIVLETLVHADTSVWSSLLTPLHVTIAVDVPDDISVEFISIDQLPKEWNETPAPEILQAIGGDWFKRGSSCLLRVPSAIVPQESNYLFNPQHTDARRIKIADPESFGFDGRLWHCQCGSPMDSL